MESLLLTLPTTVMLAIYLLFFVCFALWITRVGHLNTASKKRVAPQATGALPLIGHLHLLGGSQLPHKTLGSMADKCGPIFTIKLGVNRALVVSDWEMTKECFTTYQRQGLRQPSKGSSSGALGLQLCHVCFESLWPLLEPSRKIVMIELLSKPRLDMLRNVRVSEIRTSIREVYNLWVQKRSASNVVKLEMKRWFADLTLNVMVRMLVGKRYSLDDKEGAQVGHHRVTINKATCLTMLTGCTDTTIVTLTWALSLLLNNRHALKLVQNEIDFHVGRERLVDETDVKNLVYLQAVFKETLRLYPPGPLSIPHLSTEDCVVGGYNIPKGTRLLVNLWKLHRDPHVWSDPNEFGPERFLTNHNNVDVKGQHFELIPFGSGRRM